jgi:excisionase family DNA binding protein
MPDQTSSPDHIAESRPELLTITEAAELLRAPVATLRYSRHLGTGPRSFRLGRRVLYRRDDLHAWIDAQGPASSADRA